MRLERQRDRATTAMGSVFAHLAKNELMTAVNAVEVPDGQYGASKHTARTFETTDNAHRLALDGGLAAHLLQQGVGALCFKRPGVTVHEFLQAQPGIDIVTDLAEDLRQLEQ